ncbi:MAG: hypothetical protein ABSG59_16390 [Verrucomicrobiota bacterium]|jgi:hypothetical protein
MKITVDLSENDLKDVMRLSRQKKKGPAVRQFIVTELMLRRRREISQKLLAGKWNAQLPEIDQLRKDRPLWQP